MAQIKISGLPTGTPTLNIEIPATNPDNLATPTGKTFKYYLTDIVQFILNAEGFDTYTSCRVATTAALTAVYANGAGGIGATLTNSGAQAALAIDGITLAVNDRVLVKDQAASAQNGIYKVTDVGSNATNWVLTRTTDFDQSAEIIYLAVVAINQGSTNGGLIYQVQSEGPYVIGTTSIVFGALQVSSVTQKQVQESAFNFSLASGVNDAFVVDFLPNVTALTDGLLVTMTTNGLTNLTGTPTLQVNGTAAKPITYQGLQLEVGDLNGTGTYVLVYNATNGYFDLVNPSVSAANTRLVQYNEYNYSIDTGAANAYVATLQPGDVSYTDGLCVLLRVANANSGASTINVNGAGVIPIVLSNNAALVGGELVVGQVALLTYSSAYSKFILINPSDDTTTLLPVNNHRIARFDGTSGRIQNSSASISDAGVLTTQADAVIHTVNVGLGAGAVATNTRVGVSALASNTTGARNVAEGFQAGTAITTAQDSVAVGYQALLTNQTGSGQVAIGSSALKLSTTGQNVAVGTNALAASTTGGTSVAVGYIALQSMTNASANIAIGHSAAQATTSGSAFVAIGPNALFSNNSGGSHVAIGASALYSSVGNLFNVAIGRESLYTTTGDHTTAVGYRSLYLYTNAGGSNYPLAIGSLSMDACTTGWGTAVGYNSLGALTTGARHTAVGLNAGAAVTTASDTTAFGHNALTLNTVADNTAVGSGAMDACTTGTGVAVGKDALGALTTGAGCIAVGTSALAAITTASESTAVGFQAGTADTGGTNVHIGWQAGVGVTTGIGNVLVGRRAGRIFSTGTDNIAIGNNAMGNSSTGATSFSIFIGSTAGITNTGNNNTAIGHAAGASVATGAVALTTGTSNTMLGYRSCPNAADAVGTIGIGADAVAEKATGATSADNGPGIAIGSAAFRVGFRGDGTIYDTAGTSAGYWRVKINGTYYKILLCADA